MTGALDYSIPFSEGRIWLVGEFPTLIDDSGNDMNNKVSSLRVRDGFCVRCYGAENMWMHDGKTDFMCSKCDQVKESGFDSNQMETGLYRFDADAAGLDWDNKLSSCRLYKC